ncbi:MAG: hypothetical protein ACOYJQ_12440 [Pseudochelatococcus sp.]|uniref:hypothetical protein n=1 Tax=Pseudochelatococcus sp. TaxID=2020869 RepID=UPI003D8FC93D
MHIHDRPPNDLDADGTEALPGEFDRLLREIENEAAPARLLELALELQAALVELRKRHIGEESPTDI